MATTSENTNGNGTSNGVNSSQPNQPPSSNPYQPVPDFLSNVQNFKVRAPNMSKAPQGFNDLEDWK